MKLPWNRFTLVLLLAVTGLAGWLATRPARPAAADLTAASAPEWDVPPPGIQISKDSGAENPSIHASTNGDTFMIVYDNWITGPADKDPYYTISTNNGDNWINPLPIETSTGVDSLDVNMTFDFNDTAHAVWAERSPGAIIDASLLYARYEGGNWTATPVVLSAISSFNPIIVSPDIAPAGDNAVDVVWSEGDPANSLNANIYHTFTTNNGNTWVEKMPVYESLGNSALPTLAVAADGTRHVAWTEALPAAPGQPSSTIYYTQGTPGGGTINWASPITFTEPITTSFTQPDLLLVEGEVHLSYTRSYVQNNNDRLQWVVYQHCSQDCLDRDNWSDGLIASGGSEPVEVPESVPFDVVSSIVYGTGCPHIFFHGSTAETFGRELILGVNGCDNWYQGGREAVTTEAMRAVNPYLISLGREVYLVYENVNLAPPNESQIYWMRGKFPSGLFLPIVMR